MNPILKQRLIGALVLLALLVVFRPIIFVSPLEPNTLNPVSMPPPPTVNTQPIEPPKSPAAQISARLPTPPTVADQAEVDQQTTIDADAEAQLAARAEQLTEAVALDPPVPRTEAPADPVLDAQQLPIGWVLQVMASQTEARATALCDALKNKGYDAFVARANVNGRALYRVQIGPKVERAKLLPIKTEVDRELKVDSKIIRFTP
jgi:DedD protein